MSKGHGQIDPEIFLKGGGIIRVIFMFDMTLQGMFLVIYNVNLKKIFFRGGPDSNFPSRSGLERF